MTLPASPQRPLLAALAALTMALGSSPARADADPSHPAGPPAFTVAGSADPALVSGVLIPEPEPIEGSSLLLVPRLVVGVAAAPVRGGLNLYERHHLKERVLDLLFDDSRTVGMFPVMGYESGFGVSLGARFVHRDLDGRGSRLRMGADLGGHSYRRVDASITSAALARLPLRGQVRAGWQRQPNARFYGIGDDDLVNPAPGALPTAGRAGRAVVTRFGQEVTRLGAALELQPARPLFVSLSATYFDRRFSTTDTDERPIETAFQLATLPGWSSGSRLVYSELQLGWNSLTAANPFVAADAPSRGSKVTLFGGAATGPQRNGGQTARYLRYGVDALHYIDLFGGNRVLLVRGYLEGVAGRERQIPFTDLPRLGGPLLLRGHDRDRFRDRVAALGSVEYRYPIWNQLGCFLFVDAGRVLTGPQAIASALVDPARLRLSGGGGLEVISGQRFQLRAQVATSTEGVFFQLAFEPPAGKGAPHYRI